MRTGFFAGALVVTLAPLLMAARTPAEDAQVKAVMKELVEINEEIDAIKANAVEIDSAQKVRREEIESLRLRYPEIKLRDDAKSTQMEVALAALRKDRGEPIRLIIDRDLREAREETCKLLQDLAGKRAELEASDSYKKATLAQRMNLRRSWEAFYSDLSIGNPCLPLGQ